MNTIYVRRLRKVYLKEGTNQLSAGVAAALLKNIESLGFAFSEQLLQRVRTLSVEKLDSFYKSLVKDLQELAGAHRPFKPLYPNFPIQVMELSEAELYLNAFFHYLTQKLPTYQQHERPPLNESTKVRLIDLGTKEDFESIFTMMAGAKTSLSIQDKQDLAWFVTQYRDDIQRLLPATIPSKENLALIGAQLVRHTALAEAFLGEKIKTPTDVLRLAVALSDGDVSLAEPVKFKSFKRGERKLMLSFLERSGDPTEDMLRWKEPWKRLGERLHPGDFAGKFPKTYVAFNVLRNDLPYVTFNRKLEKHLLNGEVNQVIEMLTSRPGDLARRLDHLLRLSEGAALIDTFFCPLAARVSTPVLLQIHTHFTHRSAKGDLRVFFPKGDVAKIYARPDELKPLSPEIAGQVCKVCEEVLVSRFSSLPQLGKCYLDPALKDYLVPFSQRSASKSLRTLVRGSRLPMPEGNIIRFFLWWKNGSSQADIDLSAALYDDRFNFVDVVSYYNLKNFGGHHSGDIVDAPNGAAEFIDIDIAKTVAGKVRYVVMSLNSFTEQPYCDLPECFAGWMSRQKAGSGEVFEPKTVVDKVDLAANTRICLPAIFDLIERKIIWCDISLKNGPSYNNVHTNLSGVSLMLRAMNSARKTDLHTLFGLHIKARGERVAEKESADRVFAVTEGVTPYDLDLIASDYL